MGRLLVSRCSRAYQVIQRAIRYAKVADELEIRQLVYDFTLGACAWDQDWRRWLRRLTAQISAVGIFMSAMRSKLVDRGVYGETPM